MQAIDLVTVPYDTGRRGFRMGAGPQALLRAGLVQKLRAAGHEPELVPVESTAGVTNDVDVAFDLAGRIARVVRASRAAGRFPITITGNCFATVGSIAGVSHDAPALVWFDAHGDLNVPETSPTGFLDGMAASAVIGWCHRDRTSAVDGFRAVADADFLLVGARNIDPPEIAAIEKAGLRTLPPASAKDDGAVRNACAPFAGRNVYVHLDLDVLDPVQVGPANDWASPDGIGARDVTAVIGALADVSTICGLTVSALDPAVDTSGAVARVALDVIGEVLRVA